MKFVTGWASAREATSRSASPPRLAHADLGQRLTELGDERPLHLLDHLGQGGIEAEAGLDRDGEQVKRVRQLERHVHRPLADLPTEPELRRQEADGQATNAEQDIEWEAADGEE